MNVATFEGLSSKRKREVETVTLPSGYPQNSQPGSQSERLLGSSAPGSGSSGFIFTASVEDINQPPQKRGRSEQTGAMRPPVSAVTSDVAQITTVSGIKGAGEERTSWVLARDMTLEEQDRFRETIVANLGTRILYKHNELRLIDQEIAKCQIALEQLRRCSYVPYPSTSYVPTEMIHTSTGTGPAFSYTHQAPHPQSPAPWGVTDGPYSRHYAQWLLPDAKFDVGGIVNHSHAHNATDITRMRGAQSSLDPVSTSSRSRAGRGSAHAVLQSLPSGYAQPKPERSAQVLKRQADGKFVKLVCPGSDCGEQRFNSVQGFINHCRIKHQIHFATHEDAAQRAGTTEGVNQENGAVMDGTAPQPTAPGPSMPGTTSALGRNSQQPEAFDSNQPQVVSESQHRHISTDSAPVLASTQASFKPVTLSEGTSHVTGSGIGLTHPYNRVELDVTRDWPEKRETPAMTTGDQYLPTERRQSNMGPPISPAFVPSEQLPFLSERFAHAGRAGNLAALVGDAQDRFDMDNVVVPEESMADMSSTSPEHRSHLLHMNRKHETVGGLGAPLMDRRPGSKKGLQLERSVRDTAERKDETHEESAFLAGTTSRRRSERWYHSQAQTMSHETHVEARLETPITPPLLNSSFTRQACSHGGSPFELSPGAIPAAESNQAPSLVSDDGQSASESDHDEDDPENGSTPRGSTNSAHISFDGTDEIMNDAAGSSNLAVADKMHRWSDDTDSHEAHRTT